MCADQGIVNSSCSNMTRIAHRTVGGTSKTILQGDVMAEQITAPFTPEQVEGLNEYQKSGVMHPFTCGRCRDADNRQPPDQHELIATRKGWICPTCDYTQDWAWEWMSDPANFPRLFQ